MEFVLDVSGEFKVMHFTSSNLLHDFPNGKYKLFSLFFFLKIINSYEKYKLTRLTRPEPT